MGGTVILFFLGDNAKKKTKMLKKKTVFRGVPFPTLPLTVCNYASKIAFYLAVNTEEAHDSTPHSKEPYYSTVNEEAQTPKKDAI